MARKVWRKNFEIYRMPIIIGGPQIFYFIADQHKVIGKRAIKDMLLVIEGYDILGAYIPASQLREIVDLTLAVIKNNPDFIIRLHKSGFKDVDNLFKFVKINLNSNFKSLTNKQLIKLHSDYLSSFRQAQGKLTLTTWFVDSDGEDFSKFLSQIIEDKIKKLNLKISVAEIFSILTSPKKPSLALVEEIESLEVLKLIKADKDAKRLFKNKDPKLIENGLGKIDKKLRRKIFRHFKKWFWTPYTYIGPAYDLEYYLIMWSGLLRQNVKIDKHLNLLKNQTKFDNKKRLLLMKKLNFSSKEKKYFDIAADIIYLKSYRKDAWFYACYFLEFIHKEVARRLNLSIQQVRMMTFEEWPLALKKNSFPVEVLNQRFRKSVYVFSGLKSKIYTSKAVDRFLAGKKIEASTSEEINVLQGTVAYSGKVTGFVKIINMPEEMSKMKMGDIMVATTTYPSLVPAMKKAAAIVTNDGGITCHAAIVARELKIPCIVGTKLATRILKDGDKVSIDASKGFLKKI